LPPEPIHQEAVQEYGSQKKTCGIKKALPSLTLPAGGFEQTYMLSSIGL